MKYVLPHPLLSVGLFVASVLLSGSLEPPSLALAALMALAAPHVMLALRLEAVRLRAPLAIVRLMTRVTIDIVRSNWAVARIILGHRREARTPGFVEIPLRLRDRHGLAVLAIIITSTPGTLWVDYERATGRLVLHVLDLREADDWRGVIGERYESLLLEIFR